MERPSLPTMLWRGARRRCPWCGGKGAFFTSWFGKQDTCKSCGLNWRRDDVGFELGAAAIAAIICLGPLVVALGVVMIFTWPEVPVVPLVVGMVLGGVLLPVLLYPVSYTMWQAIDLMMRPVSPDDFEPPVSKATPAADDDADAETGVDHGGA